MSGTEKRVVMAKAIAKRWLEDHARNEHRVRVLYGARDYKNLPNLLRLFRDGKVALEGVPSIPDLGVTTCFDSLSVWSSDGAAMRKLNAWFEDQGLETSGSW